MKTAQPDEPVAAPGAATPDESRVTLRISPTIECEFKRRGVFPELRRESAARVFNGATGIHPVSVERAREILADVQAQRSVSGLPRGASIAYAHLDAQIHAALRQAEPDEPPQDDPGTAEEVQRFPGTVIRFDSRPRLMVGDVVELCRNCLPSNRGKLAIVEGFQKDGRVRVRSTFLPFNTVDSDTREPTGRDMTIYMPPENLYRRSSTLKGH